MRRLISVHFMLLFLELPVACCAPGVIFSILDHLLATFILGALTLAGSDGHFVLCLYFKR